MANKANKARDITQNTIKQLYALSGNICANPSCYNRIVDGDGNQLGEIAHIKAADPKGPRYDPNMTDDERRNISNLILLCGECNKIIDSDPLEHPIGLLYKWKKDPESISPTDYYLKFQKKRSRQQAIKIEDIYENGLFIESYNKSITGKHIIQDFILQEIKTTEWNDFKNIYIKGIAGTGKTTEMKLAYNALLDEFSDNENYGKYQFCPVPYFFALKDYQENFFTAVNKDDFFLLFLDGLDELPDSGIVSFTKYVSNLKNQYPNIRFIISGRDASFTSEINGLSDHIDVKLFPYVNENDTALTNLILRYKGTPLEELVKIPFYRSFVLSKNAQKLKTYKDFFDVLVTTKLQDDKFRCDRAENISLRSADLSRIDISHIQDELAQFCYTLFRHSKRVFTESDLKNFINNNVVFLFILDSSLIDYSNENTVSFISNIYFEYFIAKYYTSQKCSVIFSDLFLSSGRAKVQDVNIIAILLNLIPVTSSKYKKITKRLSTETPAYILLTDFENLPDKKRYKYYCDIIADYNSKQKHIYYGRFFPSHDLLANIDSLAGKLTSLLSEDDKTKACKMHIQQIQPILQDPNIKELVPFSNAIIMLGVYNGKIWNKEQQAELKPVADQLFHFFLTDTRAEKIKGLLSADIILSWYQVYGWTNNWSIVEWNCFVKRFFPDSPDDFYSFVTENDFRFKLQLFIHFYTNPTVGKLLVPSVVKLLANNHAVGMASIVPEKIDDEYNTPVIQFDNDSIYVTQIIKNESVDINDIIKILVTVVHQHINLRYLNFENRDLLEALLVQAKNHLPELTVDKAGQLYEILKAYIENDSGAYLEEMDQYISLLPDTIKIAIVEKLYKDLESGNYINVYNICTTIYNLLNISDKQYAEELFEKLHKDTMEQLYKNIVRVAYSEKIKGHVLMEKAQQLYPVLYAGTIQARKIIEEQLTKFESKKLSMQQNEYIVLTQKDVLLSEIGKVFDYIDTHPDFSPTEDERRKILDMESNSIEMKIRYDYENKYIQPPLFSEFVLKILFYESHTGNSTINRKEITQSIENWFSKEKYFWRYFFWLYVCHHSKEEVDAFLAKYPEIVNLIKDTLKQEVSVFIEQQSIHSYDNGNNNGWVVAFVYYVSRFYNNTLPDWFNRNKAVNFIAYPAWSLSTDYSVHMNGEFKWQEYDSVYAWLEAVGNITEPALLEKSFEILPILKSDISKAQIITFFVAKLNSASFVPYRDKILSVVLSESLKEVKKNYSDMQQFSIVNHGALSDFWRNTKENLTAEILPSIPFEKYDENDTNFCRKEMIEYFCRMADMTQKRTVVKLVKKVGQNENRNILLAKLGDISTISSTIDALLLGKELDTNFFYGRSMFGTISANTKLLKKYIQLFTYSLEKYKDRRQYLLDFARDGIKNTVTKRNFSVLRRQLLKLISYKKKNSDYFENIQDFLDEVEQSVF